MPSQEITLGIPNDNIFFDGAVLLDPGLINNNATAYLRYIQNFGGSIQMQLSSTATGAPTASGPNFTDAIEIFDNALIFRNNNNTSSVILKGPGHPSNTFPDPSEPYFWTPDNSSDFNSFWGNVANTQNVVLTITDGLSAGLGGSLWVEGIGLHYIDSNRYEWRRVGTDNGFVNNAIEGSIWMDLSSTLHYIDANGHDRIIIGST